MIKKLLKTLPFSLATTTTIFAFFPDSLLLAIPLEIDANDIKLLIIRVIILFAIVIVVALVWLIVLLTRRKVVIKSKGLLIEVTYEDIFSIKNCKKVIHFDECYTTEVGELSENIKPSSLCGQYLNKYPMNDDNIDFLISKYGLKPAKKKSAFKGKKAYESGSILPSGDFLLMSFAKLDESGRGRMTRDEYIDCLNRLWNELDKFHGEQSVAIPVFGSGITRFDDTLLGQQELLDIIIASYKMNKRKIKPPLKLIISCKKVDNFSLNNIGNYI